MYDQVHWNDCLVNLICVMCETDVEISDIETVCGLCEDSESIQSVIQYLIILIDEHGITEQEWMKRLHILDSFSNLILSLLKEYLFFAQYMRHFTFVFSRHSFIRLSQLRMLFYELVFKKMGLRYNQKMVFNLE